MATMKQLVVEVLVAGKLTMISKKELARLFLELTIRIMGIIGQMNRD